MPHATAIVGLGCLVLALVFEVISVSTTHWRGKDLIHSGLWCGTNPDTGKVECPDITTAESWLQAVRAFCIIALAAMVGGLVCFGLSVVRSEISILHHLTALTSAFAGICSCIAFAVYAGKTRDAVKSGFFGYQYSFYLTVVAFVLSLVASVLFEVAARRRSSYSVLN